MCVLELFCAFLSRRQTHPVLLVRSAFDVPMWTSPLESIKLAVGISNFTCCETNHLGDNKTPISCNRPHALNVLNSLITSKIKHLVMKNEIVHARWITVLRHFWVRDLEKTPSNLDIMSIKDLRKHLNWNTRCEGPWVDRENVSILMYASCIKNSSTTVLVGDILDSFVKRERLEEFINHRIPKKGFPYVGVMGCNTSLIASMAVGSWNVACVLLENGANPYLSDRTCGI